ncbi:MAG: hypothetical protein ACP5KE_03640 [Candidatus Methanodesulfokora sp.]|jgi:hypothetical protein
MKTSRKLFSETLREIMEEKSYWNIVGTAGISIEAEKDFHHDDMLIKLGVECSLSYDKEVGYFIYALKPAVGIKGDLEGWVIMDSPGPLTKLYGQNFLRSMDSNPALFLDESNLILPALERLYEGYERSYMRTFSDVREGKSGAFIKKIAPFEHEKIEEFQKIILEAAIDLISDQNVRIRGEIPLLFGIWPAEKFAKEFNIGVDDLIYIEECIQESVDESKVVAKLNGFLGLIRVNFSFKKSSNTGSLRNRLELHALSTFFMRGETGPFVAELPNLLTKKNANWPLLGDIKYVKTLINSEISEIVAELTKKRKKEVSRPETLGPSGTSMAKRISGAKSL